MGRTVLDRSPHERAPAQHVMTALGACLVAAPPGIFLALHPDALLEAFKAPTTSCVPLASPKTGKVPLNCRQPEPDSDQSQALRSTGLLQSKSIDTVALVPTSSHPGRSLERPCSMRTFESDPRAGTFDRLIT